ncbi:hypothetical protein [Flavobacterium sp. PL002]|uniref:hypothetical protein n=1 Tax=Flavobacterium sp. PL002 TaxID=1897058 RepID=UPI0017888258|nr:hypothetical protein [Flavobacterium sp. PL002]MBE0392479.1 hypothetical protein [Flavobacterium sp. PL002]
MAWNSAYRYRGTGGTLPRISEPTPWDVSILLIISWLFKRQFSITRFKANASNILNEESQNYLIKYSKQILLDKNLNNKQI